MVATMSTHTGPSPVDRRKKGCKRHVLTDADGIPLVVQTGPANQRDDSKLEDLLEADPGLRPADLAAAVRERFGVGVHPRSVERALQRRRTVRREDEQARGAAPKSL